MLRLDDKLRVTDILEECKSRLEEGCDKKQVCLEVRSFRCASSVNYRALFFARLKKKGSRVEIGGEGGDR